MLPPLLVSMRCILPVVQLDGIGQHGGVMAWGGLGRLVVRMSGCSLLYYWCRSIGH